MTDFSMEELRGKYDDLMDLIRRQEPTLADETFTLPISEYTDAERWKREVELLRRTPMLLGFSCDLPEPGHYWAMTRVGIPLILTRDKSGQIRLLINACRHRGATVIKEGRGQQPRFSCAYHAWTFGLDGKLLAVPENKIFGEVDKEKYGLTELAVEERGGIIWGMLTPGVPLDLDESLGAELNDLLIKHQVERFHTVEVVEMPGANWKLAFEGNCESYHFPAVHSATLGTFTYPNIMTHKKYGRHALHTTPAFGIEECDPTSRMDLERYVQMSYMLFPSTILSFASDTALGEASKTEVVSRIFMNQVLPGDTAETSMTISRTLVNAPFVGTPIEEVTRKWARGSHDAVLYEDYPIVDSSQTTLLSGAQDHFIFGRNELMIHHMHRSLHAAMGE